MHKLHIKVDYLLKKEINELYVTNAIRTFAVSTIAIFIPIFFLKNGYTIYDIGMFLFIKFFLALFLGYAALKYAVKKGVKHSMFLSVPVMIVFFLALYNLDSLRLLIGGRPTIAIIALLDAMACAYFFMGFHIEFAKFSKAENSVTQFGVINIITTAATVMGPLFGSIIISFYSFNALFLIVIGLLLVSVVPLFFSKEFKEPFEFDVIKTLFSEESKNSLPFLAEGMKDMASRIYWPIVLFLLLITINQIGTLYMITSTILVIFTIYLGNKTSKKNKMKILKAGTVIYSLSLFLRTFLKTLSIITIVQGFGALSWTMVQLPFYSTFYNNSKKIGITHHIFFRELYLNLGRLLSVAILFILIYLLGNMYGLIVTIMISAVFMLMMAWIKDE